MTPENRKLIHELWKKHYKGIVRVDTQIVTVEGKGICSNCGRKRILGQRSKGRGKCQRCKRSE